MYSLRSSVTRAQRAAVAAQKAELTGTLPVKPPVGGQKINRKQTRRLQRKETSLEVRMVALGQQEPGSPNKRAQKRAKRAMKLRRAARFVVGCLIRATGVAAPELVLQPSRLDFHRTRLAERGANAIYFPAPVWGAADLVLHNPKNDVAGDDLITADVRAAGFQVVP